MENSQPMIPLDEALRILDETLRDIKLPGETVPVSEALGRVLIADQTSRVDLPPFDKSAMDGYAVIADDERDEYRLLDTVVAGEMGTGQLSPGTTIKVMTGAPVPQGTARVIIIEDTESDGDVVKVRRHSGSTNICLQGEDLRAGDTILAAGTSLTALDIGNLIAGGLTDVEVMRRPRIAIISTGNELVENPALLQPGKIMNVNGPLLVALATQAGFTIVSQQTVPDDRGSTVGAIETALRDADLVVISGGVSVGDRDFVIEAISEVGLKLHFSRVAVKPGKPMTYASGDGKLLFGLPGNPVSVYLTFHLFVLRAMVLLSEAAFQTRELRMPLASAFQRRKAVRKEYLPCRLGDGGVIETVEYHGSAHLAALTAADGFFAVPIGVTELSAGDEVDYMPLVRWRQ
jgi:molybdopterin molybdotransferase